MASKEQETSEILDKLQLFCSSSGMEAEFETFAADHVDVFMSSLDLNREGVEEHPLEYHTVYRKYLAQFEAKIEAFIDKEGYTVKQFYAECHRIIDDDIVYGSKRFFIEALLATSDYEMFYVLMRGEMRKHVNTYKK